MRQVMELAGWCRGAGPLALILLASSAAAATLAPSVTITPATVTTTAPFDLRIEATFPSGLGSILWVEARYGAAEVTELLVPYVVELSETHGVIEVPRLFLPWRTETEFRFAIGTTAGSASATLPINIQECAILPADNPWNTDVSAAPIHPNSADFIASITDGSNGFLHADFGSNLDYGIPFVEVPANQPKVPITFTAYGDESDPGPYPVPLDAPVEAGDDHHVIAVQPGRCRLYELFDAEQVGAGWEAASGAVFDLDSNELRPEGWTSADAAGLPIYAGLVRFDEVLSGAIHHALRFTARETQRGYIHPATHFASSSNDRDLPPMGLRVRLKASYDLSRFHGAARVILEALRRYGMLLADNGGGWFISGATDPRWDDDDLDQLKTVPGSAFEAVDTGPIRRP